eukprot:XP_011666164.1 PREDICTED: uncharacterized protein LOC105439171 [Strongylocentrotus purpuratus]
MKLASSSSSSSSSRVAAFARCMLSMGTPPWLCSIALHEAVRRGCALEERSRALTTVLQMVARDSQDNKEVCVSLLECVVAEEACNVLSGKSCQQQQHIASQTITQHITFLIQLLQTPTVLQNSEVSRSVVQLYPLAIMR